MIIRGQGSMALRTRIIRHRNRQIYVECEHCKGDGCETCGGQGYDPTRLKSQENKESKDGKSV